MRKVYTHEHDLALHLTSTPLCSILPQILPLPLALFSALSHLDYARKLTLPSRKNAEHITT
jgi:hypothetical protein